MPRARWSTARLSGLCTSGVVVSGVAVLALTGGLLTLGALAGEPTGGQQAAAVPATSSLSPVERLQQRVARLPGDYTAWAQLGSEHLEQARISSDPGAYLRAENAFNRARKLRPQDGDALAGLAALAAAQHDFPRALRLSDQVLAGNAYSAAARAVRVDALVELGRYAEAEAEGGRLLRLRPGTSAFTRGSYLLELRGDTTGARSALVQAREAGALGGERAFVEHQLGQLAWTQGDLDAAENGYAAALRVDPGHQPARAGTARVLAARGRTAEALSLYEDVVTRSPQVTALVEYGELLQATGDRTAAEQQYDVVRAAQTLLAAAGVDVDAELAVFEADHGDPAQAVRYAQRAHAAQPQSIYAQDAFAWALHAAGRSADALPLARQAARLGTKDPVLLFHLGVVELAAGSPTAGVTALRSALALNPAFSPLHAERARGLLAAR